TLRMERPQIYFFLLPLSIITLILYFKMLYVLWKRRENYNTLFYKLIWTQSVFDISYVIVFFVFEIPQDWPSMYEYVLNLNNTYWVQFMYAHAYVCVIGQTMDELSALKVVLIHFTPPLFFGSYLFFGQTPSRFEFVPSLNRMTRVTNVNYVRINSMFSMITSISAALISSFCYFLIFRTLKQRPFRSWNREASILCSSFVLFLCLCALSLYFLSNGLLSIFNWKAMFALRMHYYAFSFPISLLNPWCLLLTSARMRHDVLGKCLSETSVMRLLPNRTHPTQGPSDPRGVSDRPSSSNK
ncbi:hypothetical protein PRIPAC_76986, partial [Pristionchus pacificus]|uniref:G protein-coupled receptor n=1 Tax=Pristionchus pacificus TaxID=54126 RepID=A0A2A6C506_PRIPA